jgi:hypothetical protein
MKTKKKTSFALFIRKYEGLNFKLNVNFRKWFYLELKTHLSYWK